MRKLDCLGLSEFPKQSFFCMRLAGALRSFRPAKGVVAGRVLLL